ncbi:MAG: hypothetical protein KDB27_00425 [Planctomycetales bacterium]|nr:hypothetical protein [Planctomycetales bacterium]
MKASQVYQEIQIFHPLPPIAANNRGNFFFVGTVRVTRADEDQHVRNSLVFSQEIEMDGDFKMIWDSTTDSFTLHRRSEIGSENLMGLTHGLHIETRPYQMRIVSRVAQMLEGSFRNHDGERDSQVDSICIDSPIGSGKTTMGLLVAHWFQTRLGLSVGWVAARNSQIRQTLMENEKRGFNVELKPIVPGRTNYPSVDLLIIDDVRDATHSLNEMIRQTKPAKLVGITSASFQLDRTKLHFDRVVKDVGIHTLVQDGYLSRFDHYVLPDFDPYTVANAFLSQPDRWGKSVVFFHRLEQCLECQNLLTDTGLNSQIVTANSNRERQFDRFRSGELDVLINRDVLTEGSDCPNVQTVFCRPSSQSGTVQMAGRVLRKSEHIDTKQIVQSKDTRHPFYKTALPERQFSWFNNRWVDATGLTSRRTASDSMLVTREQRRIRWQLQNPRSA